MTHDELLAQLEGLWHNLYKASGYQALRAVVELHYRDDYQNCQECKQGLDPCLTIQTIEKELS